MSALRRYTDQEHQVQCELEARRLERTVRKFIGKDMGIEVGRGLMHVVRQHRRMCRARGVEFPELTAVVLSRLGAVKLYRADMDLPGIQQVIKNLAVEFGPRGVTAADIAPAIAAAWPDYHIKLIEAPRTH